MAPKDGVYLVTGNSQSEQAETSTFNRGASSIQMRILIELQVISFLLHQTGGTREDLAQLRADIAASIT